MSADISPLLVRTPAAARPLWLRLRRSSPFTLTVLMCCLALLWISPFIWMLATSFSATTFGDDMASLLPRDRKSTRLNSSHSGESRMPSSA